MATVTQEETVVDGVEKALYIGGDWREARSGGRFSV